MISIIIAIHVIACIGLIFFILIQTGKGGGLIESFSSAESIFGTKTSTFLTKTTTFLAITFFITCLSLAFFSIQQNKSIVEQKVKTQEKGLDEIDITKEVSEENPQEQKEAVDITKEINAAKQAPATSQAVDSSDK